MKKDKHITIRISTEIKKLTDQKANRLKISRSEFVRRLLFGNLKTNKTMEKEEEKEYMCDGCGDIIYNEYLGRSRDYGMRAAVEKLRENNPDIQTSFYTEHWD